ncbi:MAG: aminotransferase class V-fold PLP-dependent enzyme, partial [Parvularcula sp.]|nr:aminotransferase class V-fold PLP-dependent enzyme [Parvularcula sp.]
MTKQIFLDFQATTPLDERVMEAMLPWLRRPANPHSVENVFGRAAAEAVTEAQMQVALSVGRQAEDVIFTPGATFACNLVLRSFALPGARIVVSAIEHPCVLETARWCESQGAQLDIIPVNDDGFIDLDSAYELTDGAGLVSVMAVNNEVGTMQPIGELAAYCEAQGTIFHTDAAQALGRMDLAKLPENAIVTLSSHKAYGPQGIGAICASPEIITGLKPLVIG